MRKIRKWTSKSRVHRTHLVFRLLSACALFLTACGIPDSPEIPDAPIVIDSDDSDNKLAFVTPNDNLVDRYIIWYKIYPYTNKTTTENLVTRDYDYFEDLSIRSSSDIRRRDYHQLQLSSDPDDGFYFFGIATGVTVNLMRNPGDTTNYLTVSVTGGSTYNVRRDVAVSVVDNSRKLFYKKFTLSEDSDIRSRASTDFSGYTSVDTGFAVAFLAQSSYVDGDELEIVNSKLAQLGIIYSLDGFEDS